MNFTKSLHTTVFSIATIILLSGCGQNNTDIPQENTPNIKTPPSSEKTLSKESLQNFIFNDNFQSQEYYEMMKEKAVMVQANIVNQEVSTQNNPNSCAKLNEIKKQEQCKDTFFLKEAKTKKDTSICEDISESQLRQYCTNQIIKNNALENENADLCGTIKNELSQNECKNTVHIATVRKTGNDEVCTKIKNKNTQEMCYREAKFVQKEQQRIQKAKSVKQEEQETSTPENITPDIDIIEST